MGQGNVRRFFPGTHRLADIKKKNTSNEVTVALERRTWAAAASAAGRIGEVREGRTKKTSHERRTNTDQGFAHHRTMMGILFFFTKNNEIQMQTKEMRSMTTFEPRYDWTTRKRASSATIRRWLFVRFANRGRGTRKLFLSERGTFVYIWSEGLSVRERGRLSLAGTLGKGRRETPRLSSHVKKSVFSSNTSCSYRQNCDG